MDKTQIQIIQLSMNWPMSLWGKVMQLVFLRIQFPATDKNRFCLIPLRAICIFDKCCVIIYVRNKIKNKNRCSSLYTHVLYYQSNMWIGMFNFVLSVYSPQRLKNAFGKM